MVAPLRFGITGTHSTGKTTFCDQAEVQLIAAGYRVRRVQDLARTAFARGFPILREQEYRGTLWLILQTISSELELALDGDIILVDRAVPDPLAYWMSAIEHRMETADLQQLRQTRKIVNMHAATYDLIFTTVLDPQIPLGDNQVRDGDQVFRESVQKHLNDQLQRDGIKTIPLSFGGNQTAINLLLAYAAHNLTG